MALDRGSAWPDRAGLPGWTYFSEELTALETDLLFRRRWQLVCHVADLPEPGDWLAFDMCGERALILRGRDGVVRAFHNVCRHRGSRVAVGERGRCRGALVCPFHGWTYNLDGSLRGAARPETFPPLDPVADGLSPVECEIWRGFVFVRFAPGPQPSVAALMARFEAEVAPYGLESLLPVGAIEWGEEAPVNWKAVRDVDNEGYHVPLAHPGLQDLYGGGYHDEPFENGVSRSVGVFRDGPASLWSVRAYRRLLGEAAHLPDPQRRSWIYLGLFPNAVIALYPDSVMFYQEFPVTATRTRLRGAIYRFPHEDRRLRAARYLSTRIDRLTAREDRMLTIWSCEASRSSGYRGVILSDLEAGVRSHHDHLREILPALTLDREPASGTLAEENARLLAARG